jgi:hypothetical protein
MDNVVNLARSARENLARGLQALQAPGVPYQLLDVADPVAMAMRAFYQIEASRGAVLGERAPIALGSVRRALSMLQDQSSNHPARDDIQQALSGSLEIACTINSAAPTHPVMPVAASSAPPAPDADGSGRARMVWGIRAALRHLDQGCVDEARVALVGLLDELLAPHAPRVRSELGRKNERAT